MASLAMPPVDSLDTSTSADSMLLNRVGIGHKRCSSCRRWPRLCCLAGSCCGLCLVLVLVGISGFYCCNLWLEVPSVAVDLLSYRLEDMTVDVKRLAITFQSALTLKVNNTNFVGATLQRANIQIWSLADILIPPSQQYEYLGQGTVIDSVAIKAAAVTPVPIQISLQDAPSTLKVVTSLSQQCLSLHPQIKLLMNITDLVAKFWFISLHLVDLVFNVTLTSCRPSIRAGVALVDVDEDADSEFVLPS